MVDAVAAEANYQIELDVFEGPLDLLLHLVRKHELDILDIPISFVTRKYVEYLELMQTLNLDVAGEYLLMAATLAHIKSRELLPSQDPEEEPEAEEEVDPRGELIRRLLEYQKYKEAAENLANRPIMGRNVWGRGAETEEVLADEIDKAALAPLAEIPVIKLIEALDRVLSKAKVKLTHDVQVDRLSVSERIGQLVDRLEHEGAFSFFSCFSFLAEHGVEVSAAAVRHEAVVTFLAILEMAKLRLIQVSQEQSDAEDAEAGDEDIFIRAATENIRSRVEQSVIVGDDDYR